MAPRRGVGPTVMDKAIVIFCFVALMISITAEMVQDLKRSRRMVSGEFYHRTKK